MEGDIRMAETNTARGSAGRWRSLERWSATVFLVAGVLLLIPAINDGAELMGIEAGALLGELSFIGMVVGLVAAYVGLLGLYPRLADRTPGLARAAVVLVLLPVVILLLIFVAILVEFEPPAIDVIFSTIFVGFALGITLFGAASLRMRAVSRGAGASLLLFAVPWFVLLVDGPILGFPVSDVVTFVTTGLMAIALLAAGYFLRVEPADRAEPASDATAR